jgi:galactonate dehydratase
MLAIEDLIHLGSIVSQAEFARRLTIPIANGERMNLIWEFRRLLAHSGAHYARPERGLISGLTHWKKIAAITESYLVAVITHNFLRPVFTPLGRPLQQMQFCGHEAIAYSV